MSDAIANAGAGERRLFERGFALHQTGDLSGARRAYEAVLSAEPAHFDALHMLGVIEVQEGRPQAGVDLISRAIVGGGDIAPAWSNRGCALNAIGRFAEALDDFDRALVLQPSYPEAHCNRAAALAALGRPREAFAAFTAALALRPDYAQARSGLADAARTLAAADAGGREDSSLLDARAACDRGATLMEQGRFAAAEASLHVALAIDPAMAEAHYNLGNAARELGRPADALAHFDAALALKPRFASAFCNKAVLLHAQGRFAAALDCCDRALAIDPGLGAAHNNRGHALHSLGRLSEAASAFEAAIALDPAFAEAHYNLGHTLRDLRRPAEAVASFDHAIAARPAYRDAHCDKALVLLHQGDYAAGWQAYEWRNRDPLPPGSRAFPRPRLSLDRNLTGATVFLHWEQGFGDTIQFCRYAVLLKARGARVILSVQDPLIRLLKQLEPRITIIGGALAPARFDFHCPLLSLPLAFGTRVETIPAAPAYLAADTAIAARWAARLSRGNRPRIGFAVSGRPAASNDVQRSIAMAELAPLFAFPAQWVCLQKELREADAEIVDRFANVGFHGLALSDFAETAGLIANLDLVVSVDTSVAHLAGALGKPVWLLLSDPAEWRWLEGREDTPWYPSARLMRQKRPGDWAEVIARVLARLTAAFPSAAVGPRPAILEGGPSEGLLRR